MTELQVFTNLLVAVLGTGVFIFYLLRKNGDL
jgi:hypothetical protein